MQVTEMEQLQNTIVRMQEASIFSKSTSIVSGFTSSKYFGRAETIEWSFALLILLQFILLHLYFQLDLQNSTYSSLFSISSFVVGLLLIVMVVLGGLSRGEYESVRKGSSQIWWELALRVGLLAVMPVPWLEDARLQLQTSTLSYQEINYSFKLNYLLIILAVFRSCYLMSALLVRNRYMSVRAERICSMYGAKPGIIFCLRCVFKDSPSAFITTIFLGSVLLFAFLFRIAEYQIYTVSSLTMYGNMAWMTVITMTSVGYGDYTPKTPIGRLIGALCVTWGVLIVSVMVVVLTNALTMKRSESQSLNILNKLERNRELREKAAVYLRESLWRVWKNYKHKVSKNSKLKERKLMQIFRHCRRERDMSTISESEIDFYNEMIRQFERAFINLQNLTENNVKIIDYLNDEYIFKEGLTTENALLLLKT